MPVFFYIACFVLLLYGLLLSLFYFRLRMSRQPTIGCESMQLSILVPFKNERKLIYSAIDAFKSNLQQHPELDVTFINDHSSDFSKSELDAIFSGTGIGLMHLPEGYKGKKMALRYGAERCSRSWILTVDADTTLNSLSLGDLLSKGMAGASCAVIPVKPVQDEGIMGKLFALEFMVLQAVGVASARFHRPLLANGACLLVKRTSYNTAVSLRSDWDISGGDDLFTMFSIARAEGRKAVATLVSPVPLAESHFPSSFSELFLQRIRWIAKAPKVKNWWYTAVSWLVLLANLAWIFIWMVALISGEWKNALIFSAFKWAPEFALMTWGVLYFRRGDTWPFILAGLVIYPFYLLALIAAAVCTKPQWK